MFYTVIIISLVDIIIHCEFSCKKAFKLLCQKITEGMGATSDGGVTILVSLHRFFFSSSLDTDKTWYHCFEFQPV